MNFTALDDYKSPLNIDEATRVSSSKFLNLLIILLLAVVLMLLVQLKQI